MSARCAGDRGGNAAAGGAGAAGGAAGAGSASGGSGGMVVMPGRRVMVRPGSRVWGDRGQFVMALPGVLVVPVVRCFRWCGWCGGCWRGGQPVVLVPSSDGGPDGAGVVRAATAVTLRAVSARAASRGGNAVLLGCWWCWWCGGAGSAKRGFWWRWW